MLFLWIALCCLVGNMADKKGRSGLGFFCLSLFLTPLLGIICAYIATPNLSKIEERALKSGTKKRCPDCVEIIKIEANVCRFCGFNNF